MKVTKVRSKSKKTDLVNLIIVVVEKCIRLCKVRCDIETSFQPKIQSAETLNIRTT